ncbi:hypothetical protein TSUD_208200 [Trifolium subterraneum]|uniref:Response regulatory domain-containing protein n=1 Tax=Trifolium subterraneum TaxID=3900 RepID=A0A2Z6NHX9_TRISU|nr:hypothetical protein TSUD_208200 [Trifolium subterraneum]
MEKLVYNSEVNSTFFALYNDPYTMERFRHLCRHHLRAVVSCSSIAEAIQQLIDPNGFYAIVVDMELAELNGFNFIHLVRDREINSPVYVTHNANAPILNDFMDRATAGGVVNFFTALNWNPNDPFTDTQVPAYILDSYIQSQGIAIPQVGQLHPDEGEAASLAQAGQVNPAEDQVAALAQVAEVGQVPAAAAAGIAAQDDDAANDPLFSLSLAPPATAQEEIEANDPVDKEDTAANDQSMALSLKRLAAEAQEDPDPTLLLSLKQPTSEASSSKKRKHE